MKSGFISWVYDDANVAHPYLLNVTKSETIRFRTKAAMIRYVINSLIDELPNEEWRQYDGAE